MNRISPIQMGFHFFYSGLRGDQESAARIVASVVELRPGEIFSFLMALGGTIDSYSQQMEFEYPLYKEYKDYLCSKLVKGSLQNEYYISGKKE